MPGPAASVVCHLALALDAAGVAVSVCAGDIAANVGRADIARLQAMMRRPPGRRFHIHWSPCPDGAGPAEAASAIHAEFFLPRDSARRCAVPDLDLVTRQIVTNSRRKLTLSRFGAEVLTGLGVPAERCAVIPPGCSPALAGGPRTGGRWRKHGYVFLAVADSSDPDRCRTDSLLDAATYTAQLD